MKTSCKDNYQIRFFIYGTLIEKALGTLLFAESPGNRRFLCSKADPVRSRDRPDLRLLMLLPEYGFAGSPYFCRAPSGEKLSAAKLPVKRLREFPPYDINKTGIVGVFTQEIRTKAVCI